jgi:hypothetical protein
MEVEMSNNSWRILIALAVAIHGIGHTYFLVYALGLVQRGQADRSWLLSGRLPDAAVGAWASSSGCWRRQALWRPVLGFSDSMAGGAG